MKRTMIVLGSAMLAALVGAAVRGGPGQTAEPAPAPAWDKYWPVTANKFDGLRWQAAPLSKFKSCVGTALDGLEKKTASQLSEARARAKSCITVAAPEAKVCLAPTAADCTSLEWLSSWCGRGAIATQSSNKAWTCYAPLQAGADAWKARTGVAQTPTRVPEKMQAGETVRRTWLERGNAWRVKAKPPVDRDSYSPPATSTGPTVIGPTLGTLAVPYLGWGFNGGGAGSCQEYAYEKHWDMNEMLRGAKAAGFSARWIADRFFRPATGARVLITAGGGWDLRDRAGAAASPPSLAAGDDFMWLASAPGQAQSFGTFKNAYYYLSRLYDGEMDGYSGRLGQHMYYASWEGERSDQRKFYTVTPGWHRQMDAVLRAEGWLDEELEYLRDKQEDLMRLHDEWIELDAQAACAPGLITLDRWGNPVPLPGTPPCPGPNHAQLIAARDAKWAELQAALAEGHQLGCLGVPDAQVTPCDWAPSRFADAVLSGHEGKTRAAEGACVRVAGAAAFSEANLDAHFPLLSATGGGGSIRVSIPASEITRLNNLRSGYINKVYTASTALMDQYLVDEPNYRRELLASAGRNFQAFNLSRTAQKAKTHETEHAGATFTARSHSALRPSGQVPDATRQRACGIGAFYELEETGRFASVMTFPSASVNKELANFEFWKKPASETVGQAYPVGGVAFGASISVSRREVYAPVRATVTSGQVGTSVSLTAGANLPLVVIGPFSLNLSLRASAGAYLTLAIEHSSSPVVTRVQDPTCNLRNESIAVTFEPGVTSSVGVALAAAVGVPGLVGVEIGIEAGIVPIELGFPMGWSHTKTIVDDTSLPAGPEGRNFLSLQTGGAWSGAIRGVVGRIYLRAYASLQLLFFSITLWSHELAHTLGFPFNEPLWGETQTGVDVCYTQELKFMMGQGPAPDAGCKCALRNNTLPECQ